jgi:hypothetical protein
MHFCNPNNADSTPSLKKSRGTAHKYLEFFVAVQVVFMILIGILLFCPNPTKKITWSKKGAF